MTAILIDRQQALAIVTLNRPERLNAMDLAMMGELRRAMDDVLNEDAVRAILVAGAGRAFCAGLDLKGAGNMTAPGDLLRDCLNPMVLKMIGAPKPIVCAVNGPAAGVGCALALACDIVVSGRSASFSQAFVRIGAVPDAGTSWILPRLAGHGRARAMMLLGETISAVQAADWGLVYKVHDDESLQAEALALATFLASGPTRAYAGIKRLLDRAAMDPLDAHLGSEARMQDEMFDTADREEGVLAFLDRREARFTGR